MRMNDQEIALVKAVCSIEDRLGGLDPTSAQTLREIAGSLKDALGEGGRRQWLVRRYVAKEGLECPICHKAEGLRAGEGEPGGADIWQEVSCEQCGAVWDECYEVTGLENLRVGERTVPNDRTPQVCSQRAEAPEQEHKDKAPPQEATFPVHKEVMHGRENVQAVVTQLVTLSQWFVVTPQPDGWWEVTVKAENAYLLTGQEKKKEVQD